MFRFILFLAPLITLAAQAEPQLSQKVGYYYGSDIYNGQYSIDLKSDLHHVLNSYHLSKNNSPDKIVEFCSEDADPNCYSHAQHGYKTARRYLFGLLHLWSERVTYSVQTTYCLDWVENDELPADQELGPMQIPSANVINTEHAWPQSKFTLNFPKGLQKSDLHALFPVRSQVNSTRGNHPFGYVSDPTNSVCDQASFGHSVRDYNLKVFEPANESKGNIARALFYFSTRYNIAIDEGQESVLREWHELDPVDFEEIHRNDEIYKIQFVRNPYIDNPDWVSEIHDF